MNLTITSTSHFIVNYMLAFITTIESMQSTIFESVIYKTIQSNGFVEVRGVKLDNVDVLFFSTILTT